MISATGRIGATPPEGLPVDVTDMAAVEKLVADIVAKHGRLDVLVNTVGGYAGGESLWDTNARLFDQMLQLNLRAGYILARSIVPQMIRQKRGWIVNIASKAAVDHAAGGAFYAASKAGALALFDSLAAEVKPHNINVNSVLPSIIDTAANRKAIPGADFSKWPKPEEIAPVILFLCSEEARVIHGSDSGLRKDLNRLACADFNPMRHDFSINQPLIKLEICCEWVPGLMDREGSWHGPDR